PDLLPGGRRGYPGRSRTRLDDGGPGARPAEIQSIPQQGPGTGHPSRPLALCRALRRVPWKRCRRQKQTPFFAHTTYPVGGYRGRRPLAAGQRKYAPWYALVVQASRPATLAAGQLFEVFENCRVKRTRFLRESFAHRPEYFFAER